MAYEFRLPDLGEGLTEGEVARWLVAEGDEIAEDQPLVEIQTDKTTVEIPSPAAGTVTKILVADGDVVPVGTVLVVIDGGTAVSETSQTPLRDVSETGGVAAPPIAAASGRVQATPLVRRIAGELGVDLATVTRDRARRADHARPTCEARRASPRRRSPRAAARSSAACGGRSPST